jgi:hypothetical protein
MIEDKKSVSFTVRLSTDDAEALRVWARYHGKGLSAYGAQIISSRIEANLALIDGLADRAAASRNMSRADLLQSWLGKGEDETED